MPEQTPYYDTIQIVRATLSVALAHLDRWFTMPDALRAYKPHNNGWSIDEILEHIALTNHFLLVIIRKGCAKALRRLHDQRVENGQSDLQKLAVIADNASLRWKHPEHMTPTGTALPAEVHQRIYKQFQECFTLLDRIQNGEGALYTVRMSVANLGKIDMYQWLFFLAQHAQRHHEQMERNAKEYEQILQQHTVEHI